MQLKRDKDSHKGANGEVLVIGGSEIYSGAPALSAMAALRIGVDLTYIAAPERAANIVACYSPNFITIPLGGKFLNGTHLKKIKPWMDKANVIVLGPGLGLEPETKEAVLKLVEDCDKPLILDADGLKAIKNKFDLIRGKKVILTPHRAEFELLSGTKASPDNVRKFAANLETIILLKAPHDIISDGKRVNINKTGNSGMTVGGTGDVLAGIVAGLIAQGIDLFKAAKDGARICGEAGDLCYEKLGYGFLATDVIERIGEVI